MSSTPFAPVSVPRALNRRDLLLTPLSFEDLAGFRQDDHLEAFRVLARSSAAIVEKTPPLRDGVAASAALKGIAKAALRQEMREPAQARQFFERHFRPCRVSACARVRNAGFLTG